MLTGVILAGGRSRRMGRDKALLLVAGEMLWQRQARVLRDSGATSVRLVLRPEQQPPPGADAPDVQLLRDVHLDAGPIAGLHSALVAPPSAHWYFTLAVDLPRVQPDWFRWLSGFCDGGSGAIARHDTGYEPLAAIYPAAAGPVIARHIARGEYSLQQLADRLVQMQLLQAIQLPARRRAQLANWNTPADIDTTVSAPEGSVHPDRIMRMTPAIIESHIGPALAAGPDAAGNTARRQTASLRPNAPFCTNHTADEVSNERTSTRTEGPPLPRNPRLIDSFCLQPHFDKRPHP
jgi:molybdopterin-guanine dinucleotide biosynthesis protein A